MAQVRVLLAALIAFNFIGLAAQATITIKNVTGSVSDFTIPSGGASATLYRGAIGTACSSGTDETCSNCTSALAFGSACSTKYVRSGSYVTITYRTDFQGTMKVTATSTTSGTDLDVTGSTTDIKGGDIDYTVRISWDDIITYVLSTTNHKGAMFLIVGAENAQITVNQQTTGDDDSDCTNNIFGACDFRLFPGDEKIYLELDTSSDYPVRSGELNFKGVRVYYQEISEGDVAKCPDRTSTSVCDPSMTFTYGNSYKDIDIDSNKNFDEQMLDFENDKRYCFKVVNRDVAGNLGYELSVNGTDNNKCVSAAPSEVMGLLSKQANCFIASAAYGSALDPRVEVFRKFRDHFLIPTKWGRSFVKWYYANSPTWAHKIENNETAKSAVRLVLWPLWLMSLLLLNVSPFILMLSLLVGLVVIVAKMKSNRATLGVILLLCLPLQVAKAQDAEEEMPPQEAPFVSPEEEAPAKAPPPQLNPAQSEKNQQRAELLKKNIETEQAQVLRDNEKIDILENELRELEATQRQRRMRIGSKNEKVLNIESQERLQRNPPRMSKKTDEILYPRFESPQKYGGSFRVGKYAPTNLQNPETTLYFDDVYDSSSGTIILLDFEWQFFKSLGKAGLKAGTGIFTTGGKGRFKNNPTTQARENFTFLMLPNTVGGVYRLQLWEKQPVVPFVEAGGGYFTFVEFRDDFKRTKYGGTPVAYWSAGGSLALDFLSPTTMAELDSDYGINHMWLTAEYRSYVDVGGNFDFSDNSFSAGIFFEF